MIKHIQLTESDIPALETFLLARMSTSLFLLGNLRSAGMAYNGARYQGTYAAAVEDGTGQIVGVAAHYWNGNVMLQVPPAHASALLRAVLTLSGRALRGLLGALEQVQAARDALDLTPERVQLDAPEILYTLALAELRVPPALANGAVQVRRAVDADLDELCAMQVDFAIESLNEHDSPELRCQQQATISAQIAERRIWIAEAGGRAVAKTAFNAQIDVCVQVGGVFTPLALRGRGYARCAVAQSLLDARAGGATQAVLFTPHDNSAAQRAYQALGFVESGAFGLVLLKA
jgi:uncharacterized protein